MPSSIDSRPKLLLSDLAVRVITPFPAGRRLYGLQDEGNGRVRGALVFDEFTAQPDPHERFVVFEVEHDNGNSAVGVEGRGSDEVVAVGSTDDAFGSGTDEAGELA